MAGKSFQVSIDFIGNISDLQSKIKQVTGEISKIGATSGGVQVQKQFEQLVKTVTDLQTRASQPIGSKAEFNKLAGEVSKANMTYGQLMGTIERLQSLGGGKLLEFLPKDQQNNIKQATQAVKEFEEAQRAAQKAMGKKSKDQTDYSNLQSSAQSAAQKVEELEAKWKKATSAKERYFKKENVTGKEKELASLESREKDLVTQSKRKAGLSETQASELDQVRNRISEIKAELASIKADPLVKSAEEATAALSKAKDASNKLNNDVKNFKISDDGVKQYEQAFEQLKQKAAQLGVQVSDIGSVDNVQTLLNRLNQLESDGFIEGAQAVQQYANTIRSILDPAFKQVETGMNGVNQTWGQFMTAQEDMSMLQNRLKYFFSLTNSIQLLKRTITSAMNTVKELDAVMTETAVVTDFTVGDMWDKLPEYAEQASALGASIKDLYSATTLYYQQGLNSEQAMSVGVETMKMARIAGMDAAEATKAMTAALRGFNMEINETSATRINDVYSELAAITAADTEQIATAMSKTASIADSANMEFETTAALLAQIIETTQEAPETAGTAMKTIIARFTEVKQLFDEGMLSGEDSEGEAIEINKIDAALRKVGISLTDFLQGKKGIDDIFLELASKWDTLDLATQRYIATTAAGSRQQSRFIAMMSNYDRTMELVTAANNSAGASQEQFDKTLDSMEAKLQKLKNAWNEFTMGLANNEILKGGIDLLTGLLETINKLTDALSGGSGLGKSIVNFMTVIGALKGGKALLSGGFSFIGKSMGLSGRQQTQINTDTFAGSLKAGQINAVQMITGGKSQQQGVIEGQKAAQGYQQGFAGGLRGKYSQNYNPYTVASSGFLGNKININQDYLAQAFEQNPEVLYSDPDKTAKFVETFNTKGVNAANQQLKEMGGNIQGLTGPVQALQVNFQSLGMAAMGVGTAISLLGGLFEKLGMEEAAETARTLGGAIMGIGSVLTLLGPMLNSLGLAIGKTGISFLKAGTAGVASGTATTIAWLPIAAIFLGVVAAIAILVAAFQAIHAASPEGKLEAATEAANDAAEAAENAAQAYEHLASALDLIGGKSAALENLAVGTTEWKNAVQELNGEVLDLVEQYPELAKFIDSSEGYLKIDKTGTRNFIENGETVEKTVDDVLSGYQEKVAKSQSAVAASNIQKQLAQQDVYYDDLPSYAKVLDEQSKMDLAAAEKKLEEAVTENDYLEAYQEIEGIKNKASKKDTDELARKLLLEGPEFDENGKLTGDFAFLGEVGSKEFQAFQDYAQKLSESDSAIKVFTDSLLSNALMIADVSEDQKTNMMNFMDSKQIDSIRKKEENDIKKGGIDKAEKEDYAKAMGYEFIDGKFYIGQGAEQKEVVVSDDSIAAQLAGIQAQDDLTGRMEALNGVLGKIDETSESIPGIFERMTEKGEGAAMTFKDIGEIDAALENTGEGSELDSIYKEYGLEAVYGSYDEFISFLKNSAELAKNQYDKATENLATVGMSDMIGFMERQELDISQTKSISDLLYTSVLESGLDSGKELASQIKAGIEEQEYGDIFAKALSMIDIENIDSIRQLSEYLKELGYAGKITDIDGLEQQIISATNAAKNFNLDNLKEELKTVQDLVKDIEGREEIERAYTEEEYNALVKGGANKDQFVMTGIDEFIYVGETNESLISALQENTAALMGETQEQLRQAAKKSQTWAGLKEGTEEQKGQYDLLKGLAEGSTNIKDVDLDEVETAMIAAGLLTSDLINQQGEFIDNAATLMLARIQTGYDTYGSDPAISGNLGAYENYMGSMPQMYYSQMTGQQILNAQETFQPEGQSALGAEEDYTARQGALDAKLVQQEGGVGEYEYMLKNNEAWREHETLVKAAVVDANNYEKKLTKLADSIEENAEALSDSKKGTREYQKALNKVTEAAKDAFGDNITEEFVEENIDLFKEFAKGSEDSVDGIREAILQTYENMEVEGQNVFGNIQNAAESLDGLNFDIYGHADASQVFAELAAVMGSAEAAAAVLESLGYSVTWELTGTTIDEATGMQLNSYRAVVTDAAGNAAGARKGGGGGGGGGGSEWENPYDKLYNLTEKINQAIREREKLERRYDRLIERRQATAAELFENSQAEIESLEKQAELQQKMIDGRREMLQEEMDENKDLQKYAIIDKETGQITINWDLINSVTDEEEGKKIEEYISKLEELRDSMQDAQDALEEIEDAIWEIEERGREEYLEFEDRIKEALVEVLQKEIDELEEINESINDTNSKLIDSIQNSIDKMRQERENEETEQDLQEKQRRLTYLEQDTSGANAMEILDLREEIRQGQEDYTDTLIDQKISELQEQNDKAAEQREQQITLMQNQLDWYVESGRIWAEVETLMKEGLNPQGGLIRGSMLEQILQKGESWKALSEIGQMDWLLDLETMIAQSSEWRMKGGQLENLENKLTGQKIEFTNSKGEKLSGTVDDKGNVVLDDGTYYKNVYQWIDGTYHTTEEKATKPKTGSSNKSKANTKPKKENKVTVGGGPDNQASVKESDSTVMPKPIKVETESVGRTATTEEKTFIEKAKDAIPEGTGSFANADSPAAVVGGFIGEWISNIIKQYKTGGLADYTGPAWLDGTKSRPELVLNQRDTQNFIQLKDILSSIMSRNLPATNTSTENNGDLSFDIDINVESLQSDYDVEQVASKVKSMIVDNARYRNNNAISLTR